MENAPNMDTKCIDHQLFIVIVQQYDDTAFRQKTLQDRKNTKARKRTIAQSGTDERNIGLLSSGNPFHLIAPGCPRCAANQVATTAKVKKHEFTTQCRPI
jgi:hypothetical protein